MGGKKKKLKLLTQKDAKIEALVTTWGWVSKHCEGDEFGEYGMGDELSDDVYNGRYSLASAKRIALEFHREQLRLIKRIKNLRENP